jgi:uncharacterized protein (DUF697 family)
MTKGTKTTEFYLALFGSVLGVVVTLGWLTPEQSTELAAAAEQIAGGLITALSVFGYNISRGNAKKNTE